MRASHSKKLSSLIGPATIPSGGFNVSSTKNGNKKFKIQPIAHTDNVASRMIWLLRLYSAMSLRNADPAIIDNMLIMLL